MSLYPYQKTILAITQGLEDKLLMLDLDRSVGNRRGKSMSVIAFCQFALTKHPTVIVATNDLAGTIERLRKHFPKNLIDTVDGGVRIHRMKE